MKLRLLQAVLGIAPFVLCACGGTTSDVTGGGTGFAPPTLVSVRTFPSNAPLPLGYPLNINLIATFSDGSQAEVAAQGSWSSSNTTVTGVTAGAIQGAAPGNTTITATFQGLSASTNVTVTQATLTSLEVTPANAQSVLGQNLGFLAAAHFSDSTVVNVTNVATWTSSNTTVASVNNVGVTTALAEGASTIGSSLNGRSGSGNLTVIRGTAVGGGFQGGFNGGGFQSGFNGGGFQGGLNFGGGGFQSGFQAGGAGFQGTGLNFNF